jgi:hypothetical protein
MDQGLVSIIVAIITGLISGFASYTLARREAELRLLGMIDEGTSKERLAEYKKLWKHMQLLPLFPPNETVTYGEVKKLNEDFRWWYFNEGGIYLTRMSKDIYLDAQELLYNLWKDHRQNLAGSVQEEQYKAARSRLSDLRDQMAEDLRSRLPPGAARAGAD